jgi:ribosome biogenesis GTPase
VVYQKFFDRYTVHLAGQAITATLASPLQKSKHAGSLIAVGDHVCLQQQTDASWKIVQILPRRNQLSRQSAVPMPGAHAFEQIIAANLDQVAVLFAAANPAPHWNMLDRYLVALEAAQIPALICITKYDLAHHADDLHPILTDYHHVGYPILTVSALNGSGCAELRQVLAGRITALVGKSGVGKTTLLNALQPGLEKRIGEVNCITGKGRHTTTQVEMLELDFGGALLDTPGMREFGLWAIEADELARFFPEMRPHLGQCRFGQSCTHTEEPGCAIRQATLQGQISPRRYQSYLRLRMQA